ncbi:SDR family oxidoreductase [Effusibacillus lacus]|uniref:UDP-glucose 4-epimerase n=1 Tax=Effusibacillus lacus TaxID=1348429 RepID=A0A292YKU6_9BACL|nr:SDR family oxidoreductase [Effusibacillus lacus]GAX89383.1 UDP-glucose 4-epimerase [Effusibacillus lacus]
MKILVTGGAGFIGSILVGRLVDHNHEVVVVDNLVTGNRGNVSEGATFYLQDILDKKLQEIFLMEQPDCVIHLAAQCLVQRSVKDPLLDASINIMGTINLLENCCRHRVKKMIYASSAAVYGDPKYLGIDEHHPIQPSSFYGISKYAPEHYVQAYAALYGLKYTILRYANVYGIRQDSKGEGGVISIFADCLLKNKRPLIYGDGNQTRDFIYVEDIAAANIAALTSADGEILNIGTNQPTSINELLQLMNEINGTDIEPVYLPERAGDIRHSYLNNNKALKYLEWKPKFNLKEGLEETFDFYSSQTSSKRG